MVAEITVETIKGEVSKKVILEAAVSPFVIETQEQPQLVTKLGQRTIVIRLHQLWPAWLARLPLGACVSVLLHNSIVTRCIKMLMVVG